MRLKDVDHAKFGLGDTDVGLRMAGLWVGEIALRTVFKMFSQAIGLTRFPLPDMDEVAKAGHSHYNQELRGGEGHMEVAKLILNVVKIEGAHDGEREAVWLHAELGRLGRRAERRHRSCIPEAIFCAVETSGEGAVNFYSRVQLFLFKARQRAQAEMDQSARAVRHHARTSAGVPGATRATAARCTAHRTSRAARARI